MEALNSAVPVEPGSADGSLRPAAPIQFYYADLVIGKRVALLDGPFRSEPAARAALPAARRMAVDLWPDASFALFGTVGTHEDGGPGRLTKQLPARASA